MKRAKSITRVKIVEKKLGRENAFGQVWMDTRLIEIDPRQSEKDRIDTVIHELLHLAKPHWSEEHIVRIATFLARALWKEGYRRIHQRPPPCA